MKKLKNTPKERIKTNPGEKATVSRIKKGALKLKTVDVTGTL